MLFFGRKHSFTFTYYVSDEACANGVDGLVINCAHLYHHRRPIRSSTITLQFLELHNTNIIDSINSNIPYWNTSKAPYTLHQQF